MNGFRHIFAALVILWYYSFLSLAWMKHERVKINVCDLPFLMFLWFLWTIAEPYWLFNLLCCWEQKVESSWFFLCDLDKLLLGKALAGEETPLFMSQEMRAPSWWIMALLVCWGVVEIEEIWIFERKIVVCPFRELLSCFFDICTLLCAVVWKRILYKSWVF